MPDLKSAIRYVNYHYYSKSLTVLSWQKWQMSFPLSLWKIRSADQHEFHIRLSHGILHVLSAMELIDEIHPIYERYALGYKDTPSYKEALESIGEALNLSKKDLLDYIKIVTLFDGCARQGDGVDLWQQQSADSCEKYLKDKCQLHPKIAELFSDLIRFKDEPKTFQEKYKTLPAHVDFLRQLVSMADMLEALRNNDKFFPGKLPIYRLKEVKEETLMESLIPGLVKTHRQKIIEQGRLEKEGRIHFKGNQKSFDDSDYKPTPGVDTQKLAATYKAKSEQYGLAILEVNSSNIEEIMARAAEGINTYIEDYKKQSGLQLFHEGFFSPRYHGQQGQKRAEFYRGVLSRSELSLDARAAAIYSLLSSKDGSTLKETVLRSFNQMNAQKLCSQLYEYLQTTHEHNAATIQSWSEDCMAQAEGRKSENIFNISAP